MDAEGKKEEFKKLLSEMDPKEITDVLNEKLSIEDKLEVSGKRRRPPPTAWKPGQSGNPGGRPKNQFSFAKQFRSSFNKKASELTPTKEIALDLGIEPDSITIGELYAITMLTDSMKGRDSIAKEIIQRIDGKIPDVIITDIIPTGLSKLSNDKLKELARAAMDDDEPE